MTTCVHEEQILSLVARASARESFPDLAFDDSAAEGMLASLDIDPRAFCPRRLRAALVRTIVIDEVVRDFLRRNPGAIVVTMDAGLCTRSFRVDDGLAQWVDLDPAPVAALKEELAPSSSRRRIHAACCGPACKGWISSTRRAGGVPILLVAEGVFLRRAPAELDAFLGIASANVPAGTELVVDFDAHVPLRPSSLDRTRACLEAPLEQGAVARYPRVRFVDDRAYPDCLRRSMAGINGVSRIFSGRTPSIAHLHFT